MAIRKRKPKPEMPEVVERVFKVLSYQLGEKVEDLVKRKDEHILMADEFDSLDHIECIMEVEEEFDIEIRDETCEKFKTVQDIINHVYAQVGDTQQPFPF